MVFASLSPMRHYSKRPQNQCYAKSMTAGGKDLRPGLRSRDAETTLLYVSFDELTKCPTTVRKQRRLADLRRSWSALRLLLEHARHLSAVSTRCAMLGAIISVSFARRNEP
jgi:hypothetical protein